MITYTDKVQYEANPLDDIYQWSAANANEVKNEFNNLESSLPSSFDFWPLSGSAALTDDVVIDGDDHNLSFDAINVFDVEAETQITLTTLFSGNSSYLSVAPTGLDFGTTDGTSSTVIDLNYDLISLFVTDSVDSSSLTLGPDSFGLVVDGLLSVTIDGGVIDTGASPFYIGPSTQQRFYVDATTVALQSDGSSGNVFIGGADNASQLFHVAQSGSGQDIFRIGTISSSQNEIYLTTEGVSGTVRIQPITSDQTEILSVRENGGSSIFTCGETSGNAHANFGVPVGIPTYTVATLPSAATYPRCLIWVSDETGGACVAFSDGTDWRRIYDGNIVS